MGLHGIRIRLWTHPFHAMQRRVHVEKSASEGFDRGGGWYLRQLEVENSEGERLLFPCNSWIGDSDCGSIKGRAPPTSSRAATQACICMHIALFGLHDW